MKKSMQSQKFLAAVALVALGTLGATGMAHAESKTANIPVVSEQIQEYKVIRNVAGENYVRLQNTKTGEFYDTDPAMKDCKFWEDKRNGTVLKMRELTRKAPYGQFKELAAVQGDACVGVYQSRTQAGG